MDNAFGRCALTSISRTMRGLEPYFAEGALSICSVWACYVLLMPPSNFATYPASFYLADWLVNGEQAWGVVAAIAAALKVVGLGITWRRPHSELAIVCRCFGLGLSGFFWTLMGLSTVVGNPDTLFGMPAIIMIASSAWWTLARFPTIPGDT